VLFFVRHREYYILSGPADGLFICHGYFAVPVQPLLLFLSVLALGVSTGVYDKQGATKGVHKTPLKFWTGFLD